MRRLDWRFAPAGIGRWGRRLAAAAALSGLAGCAGLGGPCRHVVDFSGAIVDGATGEPVSGVAVAIRAGDRLVYDGETGAGGEIAFRYVTGCPGEAHRGRRDREGPLAVIFEFDMGGYGRVEIPVRFEQNKRTLSLGEIRLVRQEG
ncbi:MAG: hypothetical protein KF886_00810 [Candidatus Hydrogenedentes bacterium]|nr:hypothetical protein [Candidatus Hydrogenedentota bacterium]